VLCRCGARSAGWGSNGGSSTQSWADGVAEEDRHDEEAAMKFVKLARIAGDCRGGSTASRVFSQFSSKIGLDGLVCLAVAGFCLGTHRTRSFGIRTPAHPTSSSSNGCRGAFGERRGKHSNVVSVRAKRGAPATPLRAYSSIGQSPRLITGLFLVRVQVGLPLFSGARSRTFT
jgi:hypothetical protein